MPQDTPVNFDGFANMQSMIDTFRKRLCYQASPETRAYAEDFKVSLHKIFPELAGVLVPNCIYRCGCPEAIGGTCGFFKKFLEMPIFNFSNLDSLEFFTDLQNRYDIYNDWFYKTHPYWEEENEH